MITLEPALEKVETVSSDVPPSRTTWSNPGIDHVEVLVRHVAALTRQVLLDARQLFRVDFHRTRISNMCASVNRPW
jgi:hypothetical protein